MDDIYLDKGYSFYKNKSISDLKLCNFVGLETYKALFQLFPSLWVEVTYPMIASEDNLNQVKILLSLEDNIIGEYLKKRLIIRYVDGDDSSKDTELVAGLIGSSLPITEPIMSPATW